ncbi:mitochondrial carrier [Panus rudis PR-1116 ss-1]|nr:mitochondrial carrier [Panus rudis PR-1116 ss-1]
MEPFEAKLVAAATGATLTALTMTPFDVVKTRLQTQPPRPQQLFPQPPFNTCCQAANSGCVRRMSSLARATVEGEIVCVWDHGVYRAERVNGFFDAVRHVWRAEGMSGLWKGTGTTLLIGVPSATCYMLTYDTLCHSVLPTVVSPSVPSALIPLSSGILARTMVSSLASPLELVRTNLQSTPISADTPHTLQSVLTSVRALTKAHGVRYLWRGLGPTLWRDVPFSGLYWAGYESIKSAFERRGKSGATVAFASGAVSGTTAALLTSPFDVLKTRRQSIVMTSPGRSTASLPLLLEILHTEGISALYAGILPRIVKIAPACGIMIACYEGVGRFLTKPDTRRIS